MFKNFLKLIVVFFLLIAVSAEAQHDTTYYNEYNNMLTSRFYFSRKYTAFRFTDKTENLHLQYIPNTTLNMGIGGTYRSFTLNLALGFGFLNPDRGRGETDYLDLQGHFYGRKLLLDFYGQFYKGFYLNDQDLKDAAGNFYQRPDIYVQEFGATVQYLFNNNRLSYRAAFFQSEWQKKSAGSFLLGWQLLFGNGSADSTIVPSRLRSIPPESAPNRIAFIETGPTVGYVYTLVIKSHFFIMAAANVTADFGYTEVHTPEPSRSSNFRPNFGLKAAAGYNSARNALSVTFTNETAQLAGGDDDLLFNLSTGNVRINLIHRFKFESKFIDRMFGIFQKK
jgi:hypothetical protein